MACKGDKRKAPGRRGALLLVPRLVRVDDDGRAVDVERSALIPVDEIVKIVASLLLIAEDRDDHNTAHDQQRGEHVTLRYSLTEEKESEKDVRDQSHSAHGSDQ